MATHRACWEPSLPGCGELLDLSPWLLCSFLNVSNDHWIFRPRRAPSERRLHLGRTSPCFRCRLAGRLLLSSPLLLRLALPFLRLRLCPWSFQLNLSPLDSCCHLGGSSLWLGHRSPIAASALRAPTTSLSPPVIPVVASVSTLP